MLERSITYRETHHIPKDAIVRLYQENKWSAAEKPDELVQALVNSHCLITAWDGDVLVGLGNALSDGYLVVYYPHLLVSPQYQHRGIGRRIMEIMQAKYKGIHQQVLLAVDNAVPFYEKCGFQHARTVKPMWIYDDYDHEPSA
jgi:GNAT superfamily N-acetyltransferase